MYTVAIMIITYHGGQCFKLVRGDTTIALDPIAKNSKTFSSVRFGSDVVFTSLNHPNFAGVEQVQSNNKAGFVISGPGEYEVGEVTARGFGVPTTYEKKHFYNTIYYFQFDGLSVLFLGALGEPDISSDILSEIADVDILFTPIGGGDVLEAAQASKLAVKLEASVVIPMHYTKESLEAFLKEEGREKPNYQEKLSIKPKDLAQYEGEVIALQV